ncbi:hypothetical protein JCM12298_20180 [Desulfothermus naphthae]
MNKKKIFAQMYKVLMILFLLFSALVFSAFAEVIYSDNFESGWGNWSVDNGIWQIGTPTAGPESCHSGSQCAGTNLNGKYDPNTDSRLITPSIYLPEITNAREEIHLRFWQWFSYAASDAGYVQISTYDQKTHKWSAWQTVSPAIGGNCGNYWTLMDVDLTNYAGKKIKIAFFHTADSFPFGEISTGWYIDDIKIIKKIPSFTGDFESGWGNWSVDNGIWQIGPPTAGLESCHSGSQCAGTNLNGKYDPDTDSHFITPSIYLPEITNAREEIHLRFWQWFSYAASDAGYVQISTYDQKTHKWSAWQTVSPAIGGNCGNYWTLMDVDLTNYAGKKIKIAFFHTADSFPFGEISTGWYIDDIEITGVGLNQLPIVDLFTSDFTLGSAPLTVHFTCNAHDPDGSITTYKWDFDGDGTFDQETTTGTVTYTYTDLGTYYPVVKVVDDDGQWTISLPQKITVVKAGTLKWKFKTEDSITSSPTIGGDGTIYVGSKDNYLYAINPDGTLKWKFKTGVVHFSSPAIGEDGTIYVGSEDNYLYAINPDGTLKWKFKAGDWLISPAIGEDGTIYVGSGDNYLYAINPEGTLKWKFKTGAESHIPSTGEDGTIYVGSRDTYFYAINPNGTLKWKFKTGWKSHTSPAIGGDGTIYVGSDDNYLYAINPDGTLKWKFKVNIWGPPSIGEDGTIYVGSNDNYLYAINPDGTLKWKFKAEDCLSSLTAIGEDGTIYVGSKDHHLYAINPDGTLKWKFKTEGPITTSCPAIGEDGTIYVGSGDHYLYAIYSDSKGVAKSPWPIYRHDIMRTGRIKGQALNNQLPVIDSFNANPKQGDKPLEVTFTCQAHDPDGSITSYKWDLDGDGTFDQETSTGTVIHTYPKAGVYNATVTVFDNKGASKKSNPIIITIKSSVIKGDLNADGKLDLTDAIIALKVTAGLSVTQDIHLDAEPTGDGRIGPDDAIFILRKLAQE